MLLIRTKFGRRLVKRLPEIEGAVFSRILAVSGTAEEDLDPSYAQGLRNATTAALGYGLVAIELDDAKLPTLPPELPSQARAAARQGVPLDTVMRRYVAGYSLLSDFVLGEAERQGFRDASLKHLLSRQATVFDRVLAAVSQAYGRERAAQPEGREWRRYEAVRKLLAGEPIDSIDFAYELDAHHLAFVAEQPVSVAALRKLAGTLDRRLLVVRPDSELLWGWFGGRRPLSRDDYGERIEAAWPGDGALALGEPGTGRTGWRLSHRQARVSLPVARHLGQRVVRYGDVALLCSVAEDDLLASSLEAMYLEPLTLVPDGGEVALSTLRAYFEAERNASSAAAALGVTRQTVTNRLRAVEERLGRQINSTGAELELAVRLDALRRGLRSMPD